MNNLKAHIQHLSGQGIRIFPVRAEEKLPALYKDWKKSATDNFESLDTSFMLTPQGFSPFNLGVRTGFTGREDKYLFVADVDVGRGKRGLESLMDLELQGMEMGDTFTVQTPTGGLHYYFFTSVPYNCGVNSIAPSIDHRCEGGYVVGPGSKTVDGVYSIKNMATIAPIPEWLETLMARKNLSKKVIIDQEELDEMANEVPYGTKFEMAKNFLENADPAVEGDGGNARTFQVFARLKDFGILPSDAVTLAEKYWNPRCEPPWDLVELTNIARNSYKYGAKPTNNAFESLATFKDLKPLYDLEEGEDEFVRDFNERFAILKNYKTSTRIGEFSQSGDLTNDYGIHDFKVVFGNSHLEVTNATGATQLKSAPEIWLTHPKRRTVATFFEIDDEKTAFTPQSTEYNMFRGFNFNPCSYDEASAKARGALMTMQEHIFENVCAGNQQLSDMFWAWMAQTLARPKVKLHAVPCLVSDARGSGKSILADIMCNLIDPYAIRVTADRLVGGFNSIIAQKKLVCVEEMYRSTSKVFNSTIRDLVTAPTLVVNEKYMKERVEKNVINMMVTSNYYDCVETHINERRFVVFDVLPNWLKRDEKWDRLKPFADLNVLDNNLLAGELLDEKWLTYKVQDMFKLVNNDFHKELSLPHLDKFLMDCVAKGRLENAIFNSGSRTTGYMEHAIDTSYLFELYKLECRKGGPEPVIQMFNRRFITLLAPGAKTSRRRHNGERVNCIVLPFYSDKMNADKDYQQQYFKSNFKDLTGLEIEDDYDSEEPLLDDVQTS